MTYDNWKLATPSEYDNEPSAGCDGVHDDTAGDLRCTACYEHDDGADRSSENDPDFCYECQRDLDNCECDLDGPDDRDHEREGCVLGAACLAVDPFHHSAECFDVEMAEAHMTPEEP